MVSPLRYRKEPEVDSQRVKLRETQRRPFQRRKPGGGGLFTFAYSPLCFCATPDPILITSHSTDTTKARSRKCIWAAGERRLSAGLPTSAGGLRGLSGRRLSSTARGQKWRQGGRRGGKDRGLFLFLSFF